MNEERKFCIIAILIMAGAVSLMSPLILTMLPTEDNLLIDGDDVISYNIIKRMK